MKTAFLTFALSFSLILLFFGSYWIYEERVFQSTSRATSNTISIENSYCFASPLCAGPDGRQVQRVSIFCLNENGIGLKGLTGQLSTAPDLVMKEIQPLTDAEGKLTFDVTSNVPTEQALNAFCSGVRINCQPQICFK